MFYVVETRYVGPNKEQHLNDDEIVITTEPPKTISTGEELTEGWLGTYGDYSHYAWGKFEDLDKAIEAAQEECGEEGYREEIVTAADEFDGIVYRLKVGTYPKVGDRATREGFYDDIQQFVKADMSDDQLWDEASLWVSDCAYTQDVLYDTDALFDEMVKRRDELRRLD